MEKIIIKDKEMKTKYKYIHFIEVQMLASPHQVWLCKNKTTTLAQVYYYEHWHQYVAAFNKSAVFSADYLKDIQDFLNQMNTLVGVNNEP